MVLTPRPCDDVLTLQCGISEQQRLATYVLITSSGPYDAAAPSRNLHGPQTKAPMHAFSGSPVAPVAAPPRGTAAISIGTTPTPREDNGEQAVIGGRRPSGAATRRRSSGGLSNPYSSSLPASGGFFPDTHHEEVDESDFARRERERQREEKYRAMKAAWGIDTRESLRPVDGNADSAS